MTDGNKGADDGSFTFTLASPGMCHKGVSKIYCVLDSIREKID